MNQVKYTIYIHQDNEVLDMGEFTNCEVPRVGEHINLSYLSSETLPTFHSFEELSKVADKRFNLGNLFDQLD